MKKKTENSEPKDRNLSSRHQSELLDFGTRVRERQPFIKDTENTNSVYNVYTNRGDAKTRLPFPIGHL